MTKTRIFRSGMIAMALVFAAGTHAFAEETKVRGAKEAPEVVEKNSDGEEKPLFGADLYLKEGLIDEATAKKINEFEEKRRAEWMEKISGERKERMEKWQKSMEEKSEKGERPGPGKKTPGAEEKSGKGKGRRHELSKKSSDFCECGCGCHEDEEPDPEPMKKPAKKPEKKSGR